MKFFLSLLFIYSFTFASDATIEVVKQAETLPSIAVEDATYNYGDTFKMQVFKALVADLNVISIFNVDRHHRMVDYDDGRVLVANKDQDYVLRFKMLEEDNGGLMIQMKLFNHDTTVFSKNYKVNRKNLYVFVSHAIAYDINEYMGKESVAWMKRKVVFSRIVAPRKSEIVIADYTLSYQHTILSGGFNIFPKWATNKQDSFYYTNLNGLKPTLKFLDIRNGKISNIIASDGMMVCSDVSSDGQRLLLTMARDGQPDIYTYNVISKKLRRQTFYKGIDVGGHFQNDDSIVFISNRLGYPNVFSKKLGTKEVEQMVYYGKSNSACSANGQYIVYKARESSNVFSKNSFNLHLISTQTDFIRRLTATGINEFPEFSKDGDAIIFIKNYKEQSSIGIIRLNYNKNYLFPLKYGRLQSLDW